MLEEQAALALEALEAQEDLAVQVVPADQALAVPEGLALRALELGQVHRRPAQSLTPLQLHQGSV